MKHSIKFALVLSALFFLSACTSDTKSMWHSRYAFKSLGQVMAMCDSGDTDACYAATDMQGLTNGVNAANAQIQQQQALEAQRQQALIDATPKVTTTTCSPMGNSVTCTSY